MRKNIRGWKGFLLFWLVLFLSYLIIKLGFNWAAFGWIDLRQKALLELLLVPLGQSLVAWFFYRSSP